MLESRRADVAWFFFFFQAEDGIRDLYVTGVQTCALPIYPRQRAHVAGRGRAGGDGDRARGAGGQRPAPHGPLARAAARAHAVAARPGHPLRELARGDLQRAVLHGAGAQVAREVVVVALEAMAGDADAGGERVQLVEARVADQMAPVPERQRRVRVLAQLVDEDGHRTGMVAQGGAVRSRNLVQMSLLGRLFGRPAPPPPPPPPPPPAPPRTDLLTLTGAGLDGADTAGPATVTIAFGEKAFTATATRRGPGLDFALSDIQEVIAPEPEPEPE